MPRLIVTTTNSLEDLPTAGRVVLDEHVDPGKLDDERASVPLLERIATAFERAERLERNLA
jgi:hypothetical protein